jgi:DNA-binding beta-propeller fold protein YncE
MKASMRTRALLLTMAVATIIASSTRLKADTGTCGGATVTLPFTDVPSGNVFFCSIAEAFFSGLSNGTTSTTYSPSASVPREQMAAFVTRTLDQSLKRGSKRAALRQFWTPGSGDDLALTALGGSPTLVESDGADLWVANNGNNTVSRVRASDGKLLETWTGATSAIGVVSAKGRIFVTGQTTPGRLYQIDPTQPAGAVTTLTSSLGGNSTGICFDGSRIWTANTGGSVSIITLNPLSVTTVTSGFTFVGGILYDGANIWVTDAGADKIFKLDPSGAIIQTVNVGSQPAFPTFDGTNIWVPNQNANTVTVVRASTGTVLATLTGNGLGFPQVASFDGERISVTNPEGNNVSLWKSADLSPLGFVGTGMDSNPVGACSDGLNFWIALNGTGKLARF